MTRPVIVGVDIRDLRIAKTGAKTYLEELYKQFQKQDPEFKFVFFDTVLPVYTNRYKVFKFLEHIQFFIWKQLILPLKAASSRCDIVFCTDYFVPLVRLNYKTLPVFHDAFFYEYPEHYNKYWLKMFRALGVTAAKSSPFIITPTEYAKKQLLHYLEVAPGKIISVHEAPKTIQTSSISKPGGVTFGAPAKKYLLHVGTLEKRKNLPRLVEALFLLRKEGYTDYSLVLAGQSSPKADMDDTQNIRETILKYDLQQYVSMPGYISNDDLPALYKNAEMYVFPSFNEGFGLPILEAFRYNTPVIVANNSCLPEVGKDAVLTFDPYSVEDMVKRIKSIIDSPGLKLSLAEKGQARLADFSWEKTSGELKKIFKSALSQ